MNNSNMPHANERINGSRFPIPVALGPQQGCCGWLTYTEYDILDMYVRVGIQNIYAHESHKRKAETCDKLFRDLVSNGLLKGTKTMFEATKIGLELYRMTDKFMLDSLDD